MSEEDDLLWSARIILMNKEELEKLAKSTIKRIAKQAGMWNQKKKEKKE